ncbi:hypothetical protein BEP19_03015 [Ammoniphilus oxalaticus]|uniref:Uncharacterized protein n=1 Tax=Ammoniphilus oxalaticus TaxID=66863 RepID=A0A419SNR0_9BACL|nr:hypothetical protein [Ammoniphilus oxalaticus]RKD25915.1 hypothetical protein BEP19_03015 [Ammoniphilus oxalaticus]
MKKIASIVSMVVLFMSLMACSSEPKAMKPLNKEGVAPYVFSTDEKFLLQSIGFEQDVLFVSFKAPQAAKSMKIASYVLKKGQWLEFGGGQISLGEDAEPNARLEGLLSMLIKEDYAIQFQLVGNSLGRTTFPNSKPLEFEKAARSLATLKTSLSDFHAIELNKEIPVALMVYDEAQMIKTYDLQDYHSPEVFAEMDLVQAVTLTFSEQVK